MSCAREDSAALTFTLTSFDVSEIHVAAKFLPALSASSRHEGLFLISGDRWVRIGDWDLHPEVSEPIEDLGIKQSIIQFRAAILPTAPAKFFHRLFRHERIDHFELLRPD